MKRVALIVGGAAALAALVAASIAVAASTRGAGGCTLHILGSARTNAAEQAGWQKVFADFKQQYGCTVTAHWQGQFTDVPQELNEAHLAHQTVDVVTTATTVRVKNGKTQVLNGPYAEVKEQLGGYFLIDAPDDDAAISWAARCPGAQYGAIEVRPIWEM